uniref:Uncharacterized protein n=1 Tax=Pinctada fucata TaxID=50426 RepID=A0A194ANI9_PINFU
MPLFRSNSQEERSKQFDTHFHPEKNVVQGIDVTKLPRQHSMQKPGIHMPKLLAMTGGANAGTGKPPLQRTRSESVGSESDPASPLPSGGSLSSNVAAGGFFASAFQTRRLSSDQMIKHEFDFK